jgi:hypothetical protein
MNKSITTEIIINTSKEKVWQILTDFPNYSTWNPFIVNIKGDLTTSNRLAITLVSSTKRYVFKPKVLSIVPNQYFDWLGKLFIRGLFDGHHYFEIDELSASQVKLIQGEHFSGILSNYILKKIGNETRNNFVKMNGALKAKAEETN